MMGWSGHRSGKTAAMTFVVGMMRLWGWHVTIIHHEPMTDDQLAERERQKALAFPLRYGISAREFVRRHEPDWHELLP